MLASGCNLDNLLVLQSSLDLPFDVSNVTSRNLRGGVCTSQASLLPLTMRSPGELALHWCDRRFNSLVLPFPSCPCSLEPAAYTCPASVRKRVKVFPVATCTSACLAGSYPPE